MDDYRDTTTGNRTATDSRTGMHGGTAPGERTGSGGLWLIIGGVIVAVALIAFLVLGTGTQPTAPVPAGDPAVTTEEAPAGGTDLTTPPAATAPAEPSPAEPAPADPAPADAAPADPATDAPAAEDDPVEGQTGN